MRAHANITPKVTVSGWATPGPGKTLAELCAELDAQGVDYVIDHENGRARVVHYQQGDEEE